MDLMLNDRTCKTLAELKPLKHTAELYFECGRCKKVKPVQIEGGTGYGCGCGQYDGLPICYDCCGEIDKEEMVKQNHIILYLSQGSDKTTGNYRGWYVSNWPGTLKIPCVTSRSNHNWSRVQRMDAWFVDSTGQAWYGVNLGDNQIIRCRKVKSGLYVAEARLLATRVKL